MCYFKTITLNNLTLLNSYKIIPFDRATQVLFTSSHFPGVPDPDTFESDYTSTVDCRTYYVSNIVQPINGLDVIHLHVVFGVSARYLRKTIEIAGNWLENNLQFCWSRYNVYNNKKFYPQIFFVYAKTLSRLYHNNIPDLLQITIKSNLVATLRMRVQWSPRVRITIFYTYYFLLRTSEFFFYFFWHTVEWITLLRNAKASCPRACNSTTAAAVHAENTAPCHYTIIILRIKQ